MKLKVEDINDIDEMNYFLFMAEMDEDKRVQMLSYNNETDQHLCSLGDNLRRRMISENFDIDPSMIAFIIDNGGKPRCINCAAKFNISHSGTKVACVVSDKEVGVDIEVNKPHPERTINRFATESEKEFIAKNEANFLKIWCLKEAWVKCTGEGIRGNLKDIEFTVNDDNTVVSNKEEFEFKLYNDIEGYTLATCEKRD